MKTASGIDLSTGLMSAVSQVLESTTSLQATLTETKEGQAQRIVADVSALIVLTGSALTGTVILHGSSALANTLSLAMIGEPPMANPPAEISDEVRDAVGEIANITVGSFKTTLSSCVGEAVKMSVPTVVVGPHHTTQTLSGGNWCAGYFDIAGHQLVVEMVLKFDDLR